jgi:predicted HTH domain antitoxin
MFAEQAPMPLIIPDEALRAAGMTEAEAKVEIACRLFDAGKLTIGHASALAGLTWMEFEHQLTARGIPLIRYDDSAAADDVATLKKLGRW